LRHTAALACYSALCRTSRGDLNISATGFMAETSAEYEVGARVWLLLPGRERASAVIRWTAAGRLGGEFAEPLSEEALAQIGA